jgi:outer membrane protein insertion porin family
MTCRRRWTIGLLVIALTAGARLRAQDDLDRLFGRTIGQIQFDVEGQPGPAALADVVTIRSGTELRREDLRESESHLWSLGRYDNIQVFATATPTGVNVLFKLTPRHPIDSIRFTDDTGLPASELDRLLRDRYGGLPTRQLPQDVAQVLASLLQDEGYTLATVTPTIEETHNPDRATLVLRVAAGERTLIAHTEVIGTSPLTPQTIIERTGTAPGKPYRRRAIEAALASIADDLRRQDYFSAIALPIGEAQRAPDGSGVNLTLRVDAGPRVVLRWDGPKPTGDEEDFVPMRRLRSADQDLLEDSEQRVMAYWQREGFRDVKVTHTAEREGDVLVVTMHVDRGLQYRIEDLKITGNTHSPPTEATIRTMLGITRGEPYDPGRIASGLLKLRGLYLREGFYQVKVQELDPEEVPGSRTATEVRKIVRIDITEGPIVRVGNVTFPGSRPEFEPDLRRLMLSKTGAPFVADDLSRDELDLDTFYRNLGFEDVQINVVTSLVADQGRMDLVVNITEGPQITVGEIRIVGNQRISSQAIKQQMKLREGQPYGAADKLESTQRILRMGVFRRVSIDEEPRFSGETVAHLVVTVEEAPSTTVSTGGGLQGSRSPVTNPDGTTTDRIDLRPRGFFGIGRRNLWGKNRSVDFFARVALTPDSTDVSAGHGFNEYRVSASYREPHAFNSDTDVVVTAASEQAIRTGFNYARQSLAADFLRHLTPHLSVSERYSLESTRLYDVNLELLALNPNTSNPITIDRLFPQVRLSIISSGFTSDRRNDPVDPSTGSLVSGQWDLAPRSLGSEVGYIKLFIQASEFHSLPTVRRIVLAGRASVGIARGFERTTVLLDDNGKPVTGPDGQVEMVTVADLPASQRFFAGGSTSVRGFQLDRLGVPEILTADGLSRGGNGVVVLNAEVRVAVTKIKGYQLGTVGFVDGGNVFAKASDIDPARFRGAFGFGFRFNSPLGPIRLDFGRKMHRMIVGGTLENAWEFHVNIGEAF